ncbi:hypothetical protein [Chryseobacterium viscerum]|uniref:hypothetical protein n=1 Tax=Chryseobacterium viscerum TaxID=1037377 RepID=UPI000B1F9E84|nr:hypothetical protein [Chryseobacterium viscerum]MCW1963202.1 hypothetical protein [Chryseobacterium viscerum]
MLEQRTGVYDNPYKFNAKELDRETGLYITERDIIIREQVYEPPHYHNKKGAHYTFKGQMPRSTNKTGKQH